MKGILKWPLIIAAIVVVGRILLERTGTSPRITFFFSVVALCLVFAPLYFGFRLGEPGVQHPCRTLLGTVALFTALARGAMVIPTYWLAYIYKWPDARFSTRNGGVVGEGVSPLMGFVLIPLVAALAWTIGSVIIGGTLGSIVIALRRLMNREAKPA